MKTIIYSILFVFISINTQAQDTIDLAPFIGNWQWVDGNKTFTVEIYQNYDSTNGNHLAGHYKMEETINNLTVTIYKSNRLFDHDNLIYGDANTEIFFSGSIDDNTTQGYVTKRGYLRFNILDTTPVTATWKVERYYGPRMDVEPANFNIPTDIILTKVD